MKNVVINWRKEVGQSGAHTATMLLPNLCAVTLSSTRERGTRTLSQKAICRVDGIVAASRKRLASDAKKPTQSSMKQVRSRQRSGAIAIRLTASQRRGCPNAPAHARKSKLVAVASATQDHTD